MIHYHGGPITPQSAAIALWKARHAFLSFAHPEQLPIAAEVCQSFALDNGAFTFWRRGEGRIDVKAYRAWVESWWRHPSFDFALLPDCVDGGAEDNDRLIAEWFQEGGRGLGDGRLVPVWHLDEPVGRLERLAHNYKRVALGSSGRWSDPGSSAWWSRMAEALDAICDEDGRPPCKLHGLRMLDPEVFRWLPLSSADSTNVARNIGIDSKWRGAYAPPSASVRALVIADRVESHGSAGVWRRGLGLAQGELREDFA